MCGRCVPCARPHLQRRHRRDNPGPRSLTEGVLPGSAAAEQVAEGDLVDDMGRAGCSLALFAVAKMKIVEVIFHFEFYFATQAFSD